MKWVVANYHVFVNVMSGFVFGLVLPYTYHSILRRRPEIAWQRRLTQIAFTVWVIGVLAIPVLFALVIAFLIVVLKVPQDVFY